MEDKNTGGPAFPSHGSMGEVVHEGMTLRDYFAAMAMQAYMLKPGRMDQWSTRKDAKTLSVSQEAYDMADAMLAAREAP
jgi:hypothetical protein